MFCLKRVDFTNCSNVLAYSLIIKIGLIPISPQPTRRKTYQNPQNTDVSYIGSFSNKNTVSVKQTHLLNYLAFCSNNFVMSQLLGILGICHRLIDWIVFYTVSAIVTYHLFVRH